MTITRRITIKLNDYYLKERIVKLNIKSKLPKILSINGFNIRFTHTYIHPLLLSYKHIIIFVYV